MTSVNQGDAATARSELEESLRLVESEDEGPLVGHGLMYLGNLALDEEDWEGAQRYFERALENQRRHGSDWGVAALLNNLGEVARCKGDYETASQHYIDALRLFEEVDAPGDVARVHHSLGYVALRAGDLQWARGHFRDALDTFQRLGIQRGTAESLLGLAGVAAARGQYRRAAHLLGASERLLEEIGAKLWAADHLERERDLASIEASFGGRALARGIAEGREMTIEDAIQFAGGVGR